MKNKTDFKKGAVFIVSVVIILAVLTLILANQSDYAKTNTSGDAIYGNSDYPGSYSEDSCRCIEKDRPVCIEGFVYNSEINLCENTATKTVTSAKRTCSVYECEGVVYNFDVDKNEWVGGSE